MLLGGMLVIVDPTPLKDKACCLLMQMTATHASLDQQLWVLQAAVDYAETQGVLFVASAGNVHANTDVTPQYPSSLNSSIILSVAASDSLDNLWVNSSWGKNTVQVMLNSVPCLLWKLLFALMQRLTTLSKAPVILPGNACNIN